MADEEAPSTEPEAISEPEPPPPEEAPPPVEEAQPVEEAPPAEEAPPPAEDAPAAEEAPPPKGAEPAPEEEPVPEGVEPVVADEAVEGEGPPPEGPPGEEVPLEAVDVEVPQAQGKSDIMIDVEVAALEEEPEVEVMRPVAKPEIEDDYEVVDFEKTKEKDEDEDELEQRGEGVEKPDGIVESSMELSKKGILAAKKKAVLGSIISIRRGDPTYFDRQKTPKFQNSYKLDSDKAFNPEKVQIILRDVLEDALNELIYDPDKVAKQAKWASSAIRAKVKEQEYDRYKIICYVSIGEKLCQDIYMLLRFLWDVDRDGYALHVHETMNLFAIGLCFGIYYE